MQFETVSSKRVELMSKKKFLGSITRQKDGSWFAFIINDHPFGTGKIFKKLKEAKDFLLSKWEVSQFEAEKIPHYLVSAPNPMPTPKSKNKRYEQNSKRH